MTKYIHLTEHERYHIYLMNKQNCTLTEIAKTMGRSKSTISREIKRNTGGNGYRYKQAHRFAQTRHKQKPKHIKLNDELKLRLGELTEPEENISISTESIYRLILKDKAVRRAHRAVADGSLHRYLRHKGKKYRKRYGQNDYRGCIPNRVDIADRPRIVDSRSRIGVVIEGGG